MSTLYNMQISCIILHFPSHWTNKNEIIECFVDLLLAKLYLLILINCCPLETFLKEVKPRGQWSCNILLNLFLTGSRITLPDGEGPLWPDLI